MIKETGTLCRFLFIFRNMKIAAWFIFLFAVPLLQQLFARPGNNPPPQRWYEQAMRLYSLENPTRQTDSLALVYFERCAEKASLHKDFRLAADCLLRAGSIHQTYQRYDASAQFYHRSLHINRLYVNDSRIAYEAALYLGSVSYFSSVIDSARYYFEQASAIAEQHRGNSLPELERLYNSLGAIYFETANYQQAKNYFEQALRLALPGKEDVQYARSGISINIANCLLKLNRNEEALGIYRKLLRERPEPEINTIITQNMAHVLFKLGRYDSALAQYKKLTGVQPIDRIKALNDMGRIYMNLGQWQLAERVFDSAILVNKQISASIKNKEEALAYLYRGQLAGKQGFTDEAVTWCNEALKEVHMTFEGKTAGELPADVSKTYSPIVLFEVLRNKASFLFQRYRNTGQKIALFNSLQAYKKALETASFIKLNFDNDEAALFFNSSYQPIYNEAVQVAYECYRVNNDYAGDFLVISEQYKGSILYKNLEQLQFKTLARVPDSLKQREQSVKQLLAFYTTRMNNNASEQDVLRMQQRYQELQLELSRLHKKFEAWGMIDYYRYQYPDLRAIQRALPANVALASYHIADSAVYMLALNAGACIIDKVTADTVLLNTVRRFTSESRQLEEGRRYNGLAPAHYLWGKLVRPLMPVLKSSSQWVIIPDGVLCHVPFESLTGNGRPDGYLLHQYAISYHNSFSLLLQHNTHSRGPVSPVAGFAPFSREDDRVRSSGLPHLPYSESEAGLPQARIFKAEEAGKARFLKEAPGYRLLHLATHASVGDDSADNWIQFYPADTNLFNSRLYINEIHQVNLAQTGLVVLSACETAGGALSSGEGLMSLSRAFLYAGSDGVVSTLWKTDDLVTGLIIQRFYTYLQQNYPPAQALQQAKISLLSDKQVPDKYKTPNYWANFIYTGKIDMQGKGGDRAQWITALGIIALVVSVALLGAKKQGFIFKR
ncbi:MAG: CHAT domain-containing protein [Dinghuibacter sp.]|nr:CHAT domain-containing protein [Dinghuibacter sp.]